jgi:hypothetical protein
MPNPGNHNVGKRSGALTRAELCLREAHPQPKCLGSAGRRWHRRSVQEAIFNEVYRKRYNLAEEAPICQGVLRGQFGYISTSPMAQTVLDGTYDFPPDMDKATKEIFVEIAQIQSIVPPDSIIGVISRERWQQHWKRVKEDRSSSQSGLHFGHYIVGVDCKYISQYHALRVSLSLALKKALHWNRGQMDYRSC